jgi:hypothetical protein
MKMMHVCIEEAVVLLSLLCFEIIEECVICSQVHRQGIGSEVDINQNGSQSSESSSYYTAVSSSSSEAGSRRSSGVLVDSLENLNTGIRYVVIGVSCFHTTLLKCMSIRMSFDGIFLYILFRVIC